MSPPKRTYLVVMDDSGEARGALRFAARRAVKTGGALEVLAIAPAQEFVQWGGVQAVIEEEQQLRIDAQVAEALGELPGAEGMSPGAILIRAGEPVALVRELTASRDDIAALVLGVAAAGDPGPLVAAFTGSDAGKLPCPVMLIPGGLSDERLEALS